MMQKVEGIEKRRLWFVVRHNGGQNEVYCIQNPSILYIRSHNFENSNIHQTWWNSLAGVFPHKHYDHCCHLYDEMSMPASHHSFLAKDIRFQIFEFINTDNNISCRRKDTFPSGTSTSTKLCSSQNRSIFYDFSTRHSPALLHSHTVQYGNRPGFRCTPKELLFWGTPTTCTTRTVDVVSSGMHTHVCVRKINRSERTFLRLPLAQVCSLSLSLDEELSRFDMDGCQTTNSRPWWWRRRSTKALGGMHVPVRQRTKLKPPKYFIHRMSMQQAGKTVWKVLGKGAGMESSFQNRWPNEFDLVVSHRRGCFRFSQFWALPLWTRQQNSMLLLLGPAWRPHQFCQQKSTGHSYVIHSCGKVCSPWQLGTALLKL